MANGSNDAAVTLDAAAIQKMVADAIKPVADSLKPLAESIKAITDNQKVIADTMAADAKAKADAAAGDAAKGDAAKKTGDAAAGPAPTLEGVAKLMEEKLSSTLKARDDAAKSSAERDGFISTKLKDLPEVYRAKLGSDPAKWATEEQQIREQVKADLAAMGATVKDVSGGNAGGSAAGGGTGAAVTSANANLTPGQASYASQLKMPA